MITATTLHAPNWVDLSTPDVGAALDFYKGLFGWEVEKSTTPMGDYYVSRLGDIEVGGMMKQGSELAGMPAMWSVFFSVADVDITTQAAEAAGATVLQAPFDIPGGRVSVIADPTGAMMCLISGMQPEGIWLSNEPGAVCWVELMTRDPQAAEAFYSKVFGWVADTQDYQGTSYTTFQLDGQTVTGMLMMPAEVPAEAPSHWSVYFAVADCVAAEQRAVELGGMVLRPTTNLDKGRFAVLADPQGATFQIMESAE